MPWTDFRFAETTDSPDKGTATATFTDGAYTFVYTREQFNQKDISAFIQKAKAAQVADADAISSAQAKQDAIKAKVLAALNA